jgi:hypothetical protein
MRFAPDQCKLAADGTAGAGPRGAAAANRGRRSIMRAMEKLSAHLAACGPVWVRLATRTAWMLSILALAATGARAADAPWLYGIHWYGDPAGSQVELMTGGKGIWSLEIVETNSDLWWAAAWQRDFRFNTMIQRGHSLIVRIERNWGETIPYPQNVAGYLASVQQSAAELANVCHIWQIGNEMNILGEWGGQALSPQEYVTRFKEIRTAIKSVASPLGEQIVLLGPVSPGDAVAGVRHMGGNEYLDAMCSLLEPNDVDGFALHAYAAPWHGAADARSEFQAGYIAQLAVLRERGFASKAVFITEWARAVDPLDAWHEEQSARFLHGALADLHVWNQTPGAHAVRAACWFIYPYDAGTWRHFSIEYLRALHAPGSDTDLWDALRFACTLNLPAGVVAPPPVTMTSAAPLGANVAPSASVSTSSGNGALAIDGIVSVASKWTSAPTPGLHWLRLDWPSPRRVSGFVVRHAGAAGEPAYFNTTALAIETRANPTDGWQIDALAYNGAAASFTARSYPLPRRLTGVRLLIADPGIDAYARVPEFEVYATPVPGDFDNDGDFDADDLVVFDFCMGGPGQTYPPGSFCLPGDLDTDFDVDLPDFAVLQVEPVAQRAAAR